MEGRLRCGRRRWGCGAKAAEGEEAGGLVEAEAGAELAGGGAEDAAAEGGVEGAEAVEFDGDGGLAGGGADGAASASDGFAGEKELGEEAAEFGLPAGLFFAGEFGEVGEGLVEVGVVGAELGEELVADAVAGVGGVGVGGVVAPGLVEWIEEGLDVGAAGVEEGAEDLSLLWRVTTGWMALRPSVQAPRRSFMRTVSAWSSRVWAVRMVSAWPEARRVGKKS